MVKDSRILALNFIFFLLSAWFLWEMFALKERVASMPQATKSAPGEKTLQKPAQRNYRNLFQDAAPVAAVVSKPIPPPVVPILPPQKATIDPFLNLELLGVTGALDQPKPLFRFQGEMWRIGRAGEMIGSHFLCKKITPENNVLIQDTQSGVEKSFPFP